MNNIIKIIFILSILLLNGCFGLRSAEGLSEGELNVNYIAPLAGSMRYGVTDNVEIRTVVGTGYDIFFHTNEKKNINIGFTTGITTVTHKDITFIYSGVVVSKRIIENPFIVGIPYFSITGFYDKKNRKYDPQNSSFAFGADIRVPFYSDKVTLLLTPEINRVLKERDIDIHGSFFPTMNIGIIFDIYKIVK